MVSVPNKIKIRQLYGLGVLGTANIGTVSPLLGKFLALYGKEGGGERGTPLILLLVLVILPAASISDVKDVANPSDEDIYRSFQNDHVLGTHTHQANIDPLHSKDCPNPTIILCV